ncbi:MAG: HEAT repeat domain-containing protein [Phycisphaerae bacterium]|nr:HEAT repeat domain-containing protein [Phycisphaerae bacterium]
MKRISYVIVSLICLGFTCSSASGKRDSHGHEITCGYLGYPSRPNPLAHVIYEWITPAARYHYPPRRDTFKQLVIPPASDWTEWWEANRAPYLVGKRGGKDKKTINKAQGQYRKKTIDALLEALESDAWELRGSAAISLGRMKAGEAFEKLCALAKKDEKIKVRQSAILAIGLLDTPEGEEFLLSLDYEDKPSDRQAALIALGLMSKLNPDTIEGFQKKLKNGLGKPRRFIRRKRKDNTGIQGSLTVFRDVIHKAVGKPGLTGFGIHAWTLARRNDPVDDPNAPKTVDKIVNGYLMEGSSLAASAIACRALSRHQDPDNTKLYQAILGMTNIPWIADETMLAMGRQREREFAKPLAEILLLTPKAKKLYVFQTLYAQEKRFQFLRKTRNTPLVREQISQYWENPKRFRQSKNAFILYQKAMNKVYGFYRYTQLHEDTSPKKYADCGWLNIYPTEIIDRVIWHNYIGVEPVCIANLRASAAIALGNIDDSISQNALQKILTEKRDDYSHFYESMAVMSLGKVGDQATLEKILQPGKSRNSISIAKLRSPLRGFAALALGLYARRHKAMLDLPNQSGNEQYSPLLANVIMNPNESEQLRAACALGMGLTGQSENLTYLQAAGDDVSRNDSLLAGYLILSRGMLGDPTILKPAKIFLDAAFEKERKNKGRKVKKNKQKQWEEMVRLDLLGSRAAVLGLGLSGSHEALPILEKVLEQNDYLADEAILAFSLIGEYSTSEKLISLMTESDDMNVRAKAARWLGALFTQPQTERLQRLIDGNNYRMCVPRMIPYRSLANNFLCEFLLPTLEFENDLEDQTTPQSRKDNKLPPTTTPPFPTFPKSPDSIRQTNSSPSHNIKAGK